MEISIKTKALEAHELANAYYQTSEKYGYKFLKELKIIRDDKLFCELGYESFDSYTESCFNYSSRTINERIQTAEKWGEEYERALASYGQHKTRQLGLMPNPERKKAIEEGIPTEQGIKTVKEATTREIDAYEKKLKQQEKQLQEKEKAIENLKWHNAQKDEEIEAAKNEQKVVTEEVITEVVPEDYEELKKSNIQMNKELKAMQESVEYAEKQHESLLAQREEVNEKSVKYDQLTKAIESAEGQLNKQQQLVSNYKSVLSVLRKANEAIIAASPVVYTDFGNLFQTDNSLNQELDRLVNRTQKLADDLRELRKESRIIEGEIVND